MVKVYGYDETSDIQCLSILEKRLASSNYVDQALAVLHINVLLIAWGL